MPDTNSKLSIDLGQLSLNGAAPALLNTRELSLNGFEPPAEPENAMEGNNEVISETLQAFRERAQAEAQRFEEVTDTEFLFCICFQTRAQKDEFLAKAKLPTDDDKYIDGMLLAEKMGIELTSPIPQSRKVRIDPTWANLALDQ